MRLFKIPEPFDHPEFLFEPKIDGFRALAHVTGHRCELVSRNGHVFRSWPQLAEEIAHAIRAHSAILDGEICCLEPDGRSHFTKLMFRREWPFFCAFDVLAIDGQDLRHLPLLSRKRRLRAIMPRIESRLRYVDHVDARGQDLFRACAERDLEGIVAKWHRGTYRTDGRASSWLKIKNPDYSQIRNGHELFDRWRVEGTRHRRALTVPLLELR